MKKGTDNPEGLTAREVIEDIAAFPLSFRDKTTSWSGDYAAFRNQRFAQRWLDLHPKPPSLRRGGSE